MIGSLSGLGNIAWQEGVLQRKGENRVRCRLQGLHEKSHFCSSARQVIGIFRHEL